MCSWSLELFKFWETTDISTDMQDRNAVKMDHNVLGCKLSIHLTQEAAKNIYI